MKKEFVLTPDEQKCLSKLIKENERLLLYMSNRNTFCNEDKKDFYQDIVLYLCEFLHNRGIECFSKHFSCFVYWSTLRVKNQPTKSVEQMRKEKPVEFVDCFDYDNSISVDSMIVPSELNDVEKSIKEEFDDWSFHRLLNGLKNDKDRRDVTALSNMYDIDKKIISTKIGEKYFYLQSHNDYLKSEITRVRDKIKKMK